MVLLIVLEIEIMRVTTKGQVTIPKNIRESLGITPETEIDFAEWSENVLEQFSHTNTLYINSIVYTEISIGFNKIEEIETAISELDINQVSI